MEIYVHQKFCKWLFIAALVIIMKNRKQYKCPLTNESTNYDTSIQWNTSQQQQGTKPLISSITWVNQKTPISKVNSSILWDFKSCLYATRQIIFIVSFNLSSTISHYFKDALNPVWGQICIVSNYKTGTQNDLGSKSTLASLNCVTLHNWFIWISVS